MIETAEKRRGQAATLKRELKQAIARVGVGTGYENNFMEWATLSVLGNETSAIATIMGVPNTYWQIGTRSLNDEKIVPIVEEFQGVNDRADELYSALRKLLRTDLA